jgi:sugar phosphate permease
MAPLACPPNTAVSARISGAPLRVLALLVVSVSIFYMDRGNLSIAAPLLKDELGISTAQLGVLLSSFFWTYAAFQIVSGWLVDRVGGRWVLAGGFCIWSVTTAATGVVHGFGMLLLLRLLLGMGESVAYPCYSKILASRFAECQRGLANSLIDAGSKCGPAVGTLAGGLLMARFGWRPIFIVLGLGSMIWLLPWLRCMPDSPPRLGGGSEKGPGIREILSKRSAWATFAGHFCSNYFLYFLLTWLPFYLIRERHFSMNSMAGMGALAYVVMAVTTTATGWISDRAIAAGATPTRVRKACTGCGLGFTSIIAAVTAVSDPTLSMVFLLLACIAFGIYASSHWAITQTIAGPQAAGKWSGLQNFVANLAGVAAPAVTGFVVQKTGHFFWAFTVSSTVVLAGAAVYLFALGPVEPVQWASNAVRENKTAH